MLDTLILAATKATEQLLCENLQKARFVVFEQSDMCLRIIKWYSEALQKVQDLVCLRLSKVWGEVSSEFAFEPHKCLAMQTCKVIHYY